MDIYEIDPIYYDKPYYVCGITNSKQGMFGARGTLLHVDAVILPFNSKITYCSFIAPYSITLGGVKAGLTQGYNESKTKHVRIA